MRNVPLSVQREVIVTNFLKVPLLPLRSVDESNFLTLELHEWVGLRQIRKDYVRTNLRVGHYIRHPSFAPSSVDRRMAGLAGRGTDICRSEPWGRSSILPL